MARRISLIALVILLIPSLSYAASITVRQSADCTYDGDGSSWSCASGAGQTGARKGMPSTLVRGNIYFIAAGSYGSYTWDDAHSGSTYIYVKKATSSAHGPSSGWSDGFASGQAVFSRWIFRKGYYDIDGVTGGGPTNWTAGHGIKILAGGDDGIIDCNAFDADYLYIRHIEVTTTLGRSSRYETTVVKAVKDEASSKYFGNGQGLSNSVFEYCYFHDIGECFFHTFGMYNNIIQYSAFVRNGNGDLLPSGERLHREAWSGYADNSITWRWNWFEDISNTAVFAFVNGGGAFDNIRVYGNVFMQTASQNHASYLIDGSGGSGSATPTNWKVYNNTMVGWKSGSAGVWFAGGSGNEVRNNIWAHHPKSGSLVIGGSHSHNGYYSIINESSGQDQSAGYAANESNGQLFSSSPFINYATGDFRLKAATMPGITLPSPYNIDMFGNVRGADGNWDRGAIEYGGGGGGTTSLAPPSNLHILSQ